MQPQNNEKTEQQFRAVAQEVVQCLLSNQGAVRLLQQEPKQNLHVRLNKKQRVSGAQASESYDLMWRRGFFRRDRNVGVFRADLNPTHIVLTFERVSRALFRSPVHHVETISMSRDILEAKGEERQKAVQGYASAMKLCLLEMVRRQHRL